MSESMYEYIKTVLPEERILFRRQMKDYTTFRVGGEAACMLLIHREEELAALIPYFNRIEQDYFILGNGSNLLVGDKGYRGIVLKLDGPMEQITVEGTRITAKAGALLSQVAMEAKKHGLTGLEFASGIPGSIGGGVVMNAGAYGGEMKQVVESVTVLNREGETATLDNETMEFGYRSSIIRNRPFIVLEITLRLAEGSRDEIAARMEELAALRRSKQPLEYPSAGSTFKRPEGHYAGKLIMEAGLRGYHIGGAQVSDKHCGFVINRGYATAADIREVIEEVQERVKEKFHVLLEPEIIFLGDF